MAAGDLYRSMFMWHVANQPCCLTIGFEETGSTGDVTGEECSILSLAVNNAFAPLIAAVPEDVSLEGCETRKLTGDPRPPGQSWINGGKGTITGQSIPAIKALMVTHKQQTANVMSNGKSYWSGIAEADCDGNVVDSGAVEGLFRGAFDSLAIVDETIPAGSFQARHVVLQNLGGTPAAYNGLPVTSNSSRSILYNSRRRSTDARGFSRDTVLPP
jgi:hypothetical protein